MREKFIDNDLIEKQKGMSKKEAWEFVITLVPVQYRDFIKETTKRLKDPINKGEFSLSTEGHAAGNLVQGIMSGASVGRPMSVQLEDIKGYIGYINKKHGPSIMEFLQKELKFPATEEVKKTNS